MREVTYESLTDETPVFIIAEAGVNHCGDIHLAEELVAAAAQAGADAVKFQSFVPEALVSGQAEKMEYQKQAGSGEETQLEMLRKLRLDEPAHFRMAELCREQGIAFLSTPFDESSVDLLEEIDVPFFKIGSAELTNHPFLGYVAAKGKPMIVSTGMAHIFEVEEAVWTILAAGNKRIALLQCVTNYPAADEDVNLRAMRTMTNRFKVPVGYSDHTLGIEVALAAAARGAAIIEKHLTLDKQMEGPDHAASLEPEEFAQMVKGIKRIEAALGTGEKCPAHSEKEGRMLVRRSIFAARDIEEGTVITRDMLCVKRPGTYLPPKRIHDLVGRHATDCIKARTSRLRWKIPWPSCRNSRWPHEEDLCRHRNPGGVWLAPTCPEADQRLERPETLVDRDRDALGRGIWAHR